MQESIRAPATHPTQPDTHACLAPSPCLPPPSPHRYAAAFTWLDNSLRMLPGSDSCPEAEATLLLMGHCMRKMREYKQALNCYQS